METTRGAPIRVCLAVLSLAVAPLAPAGLLGADHGAGRASPRPAQEKTVFDLGNRRVFFSESFEDARLAERGWYDGSRFRIAGGARAGKGCIEYEWIDELAVGPKPMGLLPAGKASLPGARRAQAAAVPAAKTPESPEKWWLKPNLRIATYFRDYARTALHNGAAGVYSHSICRMAKLAPREQTDAVSGIANPKGHEK